MQLNDKSIEELALELNQIPLFGDLEPRALLRRVPFFDGVPDEALDKIVQSVVLRTFGEGKTICRQGEYEETFYLMLQGKVEVSIMTQENPHISLATFGKGDFFGELGPLTGNPRTATITAIERTTLLEIQREAFLFLHKTAPAIKKKIDEVYLGRTLSTHLRRVNIFTHLPEEVLNRLREKVELLEFDRGEVIIRQGDAGDSLYIIRSGFVKVSVGEGEKERVFAYLKDGNYFGEMSLLRGGPRTANVTAVTRVEAVRIGVKVFQDIMNEFPDVRARIEQDVAQRDEKTQELTNDDEKARAMKFVVNIGMAQAAKVLVIDLDKCIRCHCCVRACAYSHDGFSHLERRGHRFRNILLPTTCMHCTDPECMLCPHGGIYRDKDGEIHHTVQCIHCGACARRCPYGNILVVEPEIEKRLYKGFWERGREIIAGRGQPEGEKEKPKRRVVKCDMCADQTNIHCIYNCPVNACRLITPDEFLTFSGG